MLSGIILLIISQDVTTQYDCQVGAVPRSTSHHHLTNFDSQAANTMELVSKISNSLPLRKKHLARSCLLIPRSALTPPFLLLPS